MALRLRIWDLGFRIDNQHSAIRNPGAARSYHGMEHTMPFRWTPTAYDSAGRLIPNSSIQSLPVTSLENPTKEKP